MSNYLSYRSQRAPGAAGAVAGPEAGFIENFNASLSQTSRTEGMLSLHETVMDHEKRMLDTIEDAQGTRPENIVGRTIRETGGREFVDGYRKLAEYYEEGKPLPPYLQEQVEQVEELHRQNPDIPTYRDVWEATKKEAQDAERQMAEVQSRSNSWSATLGAFAGSAVGAFRPDTDPFNFATMGVAGIGKSLISRMASESALQGAIEGVNQLTGVQRNRELLGLDHGVERALTSVGTTMVAGGLFRGAFEGAGAGFRKITGRPAPGRFEPMPVKVSTPDTPKTSSQRASELQVETNNFVKENNPYGDSGAAVRLFKDELNDFVELTGDWSRPPRTDTAVGRTLAPSRQDPEIAVNRAEAVARNPDLERQMNLVQSQIEAVETRLAAGPRPLDDAPDTLQRAASRNRAPDELQLEKRLDYLESQPDTPIVKAEREFVERQIEQIRSQRGEPEYKRLPTGKETNKSKKALRKELTKLKKQRKALREKIDRDATKIAQGRADPLPKDPDLEQRTVENIKALTGHERPLDERATLERKIKDIANENESLWDNTAVRVQEQRIDGGRAEGAPPPEPFVDIGNVRVDRSDSFVDFETGEAFTVDQLIKEFDDMDVVRAASQACGLK